MSQKKYNPDIWKPIKSNPIEKNTNDILLETEVQTEMKRTEKLHKFIFIITIVIFLCSCYFLSLY